MRDLARSAENILLPKGEYNRGSIEAFQQFTDIEVPAFRGRELMAVSGGRVFWLMKGKDIPGLVAAGKGDVGMTNTDSRIAYNSTNPNLDKQVRYQKLGDEMCRFSLLSLVDEVDAMRDRIDNSRSLQLFQTVTSRKPLLNYYTGNLPIVGVDIDINGSVEAAMRVIGAPLAADIVDTGETARQNGLAEVITLGAMYSEIVAKAEL